MSEKIKLYPKDQSLDRQWFIEYPNPHGGKPLKRYINSQKFPDLESRLREAKSILSDVKKLFINDEVDKTDLIKKIEEYLAYRTAGAKGKTKGTYDTALLPFLVWLRRKWSMKMGFAKMGRHYQNYLLTEHRVIKNGREKRLQHTTVNNYKRFIRTIFSDMLKEKELPSILTCNPFGAVRKLTETRESKEWFRPEIIDKVIERVKEDPELWIACKIQFFCFVRPAELRSIRISDIVFSERKLRVKSNVAKMSKSRHIYLPDELFADLQEYENLPEDYFIFSPDGKPGKTKYGANTLSNRHREIMRELKMPAGYTFYSWKNTGAVYMLKSGISILIISKLMGHHSLDYTKEYFKSLGFEDIADHIHHLYPSLENIGKANLKAV